MSDPKVVLITGASSGNGQCAAELLTQRGHQVLGTSRGPVNMEKTFGYQMVTLDVCSDQSVATCVDMVVDQVGRIDVLVNNAGYEHAGALEELSMEEARAQFETNFFGMARMVKAVLPTMRQQKSGQIINVSSLAGIVPIPFLGMYSASKFALEGYTEILRHEVRPFNIQVSLIEVGFLNTPLKHKRQMPAQPIGDYDLWRRRAMDAVSEAEEKGPNGELVANTILKIIESKKARLRYIAGREANLVSRLRGLLPEAGFESAVRNNFHLDKD